jgi:o-succinylbenzoate synthase
MRKLVPYTLHFAFEARTSRDTMTSKPSWFLIEQSFGSQGAIGECAPIFGLSAESESEVQKALNVWLEEGLLVSDISSVQAALEMISQMPSAPLGASIPINGLVWMNERNLMLEESRKKIADGFTTIKLKVGGLRFEDEIYILEAIRAEHSPTNLTIRLDANGAFDKDDVYLKLERLAAFDIHSIEQPVRAGQHALMKDVCASAIIPVALDEELIGVSDARLLLDELRPHYVVLKPSLHGGFKKCDSIIQTATERNIGWWATSALESSIGLNAIAHWVYRWKPILPQGLGTGQIFTNNLLPAWTVENGQLIHTGTLSFPLEWTR